MVIWNLEKFVLLFASLDSSHLENFLKHIFVLGMNRKLDFRQDWKFCWNLIIAIEGGNWLFRLDCGFSFGTLYPSARSCSCKLILHYLLFTFSTFLMKIYFLLIPKVLTLYKKSIVAQGAGCHEFWYTLSIL